VSHHVVKPVNESAFVPLVASLALGVQPAAAENGRR
jgi:hypothetical protein